MKDVARQQHDVRRQLDHLVQRARERLRDVVLALVDAARSQPLILAEAQVEVGEVNEAQGSSGREAGRQMSKRVLTGCADEV